MIESHLKSKLLSGRNRFDEHKAFHPLPIITVVVFVWGFILNNNLHTVIVLERPHSLRYLWLVTFRKLPRSYGKIWKEEKWKISLGRGIKNVIQLIYKKRY